MKTKATFYSDTVTKNSYQEDIHTYAISFSAGCEVRTVQFKDKFEGSQLRTGTQVYCTVRKSPLTSAVARKDKVVILGVDYRVIGIDPMVADFSRLMFLLDADQGGV